MLRFLLIISFFLLSGCGERHCIQPHDIGVREKLNVVSTQQKWVGSEIEISEGVKVTEIDIVASKLNFCTGQYEMSKDFLVRPGYLFEKLPFELKKGDTINFSIVENKMCKNKDDGKERYVTIYEKCNEKEETEYFAKTLNQKECTDNICPNKYISNNAKWLNGKEYWPNNMKEDEEKKTREEIEKALKQNEAIDYCSKLSNITGKIDTYLLNFMYKKCNIPNFVQVESLAQNEELIADLESALNDTKDGIDGIKVAKAIKKFIEQEEAKTYIPSLKVSMQDESFDDKPGSIRSNYDHEIKKDHSKGEELSFYLGNGNGKGGYNIRVERSINPNKSLYIHVADSLPEHNPGDNQADDIPVEISQAHNLEYMDKLIRTLNQKVGKIYYGIRDHGCDYKNNEGEFSINIITKEPPIKTFSAIYNFFDKGVKKAFFGSNYQDNKTSNNDLINRGDSPTKRLYESFIKSNEATTIRSTIIALLILYIVLYTLYYFFGLSHASIYEFLIICVKVGTIAQLLRDDSWNFFYDNAFSLFVNAPNQLIGIANLRGTSSNVFEFLDLPLNRFLSSQSILLIVSLLFSGPLGIVAFCLVIWGFIIVTLSIFNTLFSFITSIAIIALLLSLAPVFIICVLFKYTRQMFFKWVGYLARFAIHPVILLIFISLISQVMDYIVYSLFNFEVCSECIFSINLRIFEPCIFHYYAAKHAPNITAIMAFIILGHAMKALLEAASEISDTLFSSYVASEPGEQYKQSLLGVVGLDQNSVQERKGAALPSQTLNQRPQIPQKPQVPNEK